MSKQQQRQIRVSTMVKKLRMSLWKMLEIKQHSLEQQPWKQPRCGKSKINSNKDQPAPNVHQMVTTLKNAVGIQETYVTTVENWVTR